MLTFSLLGSFGIASDNDAATSGLPRRCVSLLSYVLLRRPERVYRERVAAALWPDALDAEARGNLRRHLYLLGRAIPQSRDERWLVYDAATVGWNPAVAATTDVELLRAAVSAENWAAAVAYYKGELLAECDDEWLIDERERLREGHISNLERLAAAERVAGSFPAAVKAAQELLRLEPWREAAIRILMEARAAMGDRAGALAAYERFAQRLRGDLDVEPMAETTALYTDLVRRSAPVVQRVPPPKVEPRVSAPFVGRETELETLREAWSRTLQQRGGLAFVGGESGVGKTRLVDELAASVVAGGGAVLRGGTTFIETSPYQALVEALRGAMPELAGKAERAPWRAALRPILPELLREHDTEPAVTLGPEAERSRLFEAVVAALQSFASTGPVLVILEDLHWAGSGTVAMVAHLSRRVLHERITIVATYRDDDLPRAHPLRDLRRQLVREGSASVVALGPLTAPDVERFFALRFGTAADDVLAGRYHAATEGLPLFLVELLAGVTNARALSPTPATELPQSLTATIERRMADLPEPARAAMEIAAVIGAGFDLEVIAEASGWSEAETLGHVGDLMERHVVRELPGSGAAYAFAHAFYRESAYTQIPVPMRRQRHARVARALAELYPGRLSELAPELARHYEEAGDAERAVLHLVASARRASELFANEDALAYSERALALRPRPPVELELRLLREEAHRRLGRREAQRAELDALAELARSAGDREAELEAVQRRIALAHITGDRATELGEIERAVALSEGAAPLWSAKLALARGRYHLRTSAHGEAREQLQRAARSFEAVGDAREAFETYIVLAEVERICEALPAVERCFAEAERLLGLCDGARAPLMRLYEERASFSFYRQRYLEADLWARRLLETAEAIADVAGQARAYYLLGSAAGWRFDIVTARAHLTRASELFEAIDDRHHVYAVGFEFGLLAVWLGHVDEALVRFERARAAAQTLGNAYGLAICAIALGHAATLVRDFGRAEEHARSAIEIAQQLAADSVLAPALVNLGIALVHRGALDEARTSLEQGRRLAEHSGRADLTAEAWSYLALVYAASDEPAAALAAARETLALVDAIPQPLRSGDRYWTVAAALRRAGDPLGAQAALRQGHAVVSAQLASIPDEESRRAFGALPAHHAILTQTPSPASSDVFRTVYA
jgi:predicted ATPase/DNA-binding SARP family transcriptional activator